MDMAEKDADQFSLCAFQDCITSVQKYVFKGKKYLQSYSKNVKMKISKRLKVSKVANCHWNVTNSHLFAGILIFNEVV